MVMVVALVSVAVVLAERHLVLMVAPVCHQQLLEHQ
jgi:hypothetical protein